MLPVLSCGFKVGFFPKTCKKVVIRFSYQVLCCTPLAYSVSGILASYYNHFSLQTVLTDEGMYILICSFFTFGL